MEIVAADMGFFGVELLFLGLVPILVLFAANYCINFGIAWVFRKASKMDGRPSFGALALVTFLGLAIDSLAFILGYALPDVPTLRVAFIGVFVMLGMAAATYWFVFKEELEPREAVLASFAFGIISNPVWLLLAIPALVPH